jgi:hypothetical protein
MKVFIAQIIKIYIVIKMTVQDIIDLSSIQFLSEASTSNIWYKNMLKLATCCFDFAGNLENRYIYT